MQGRNSVDAEKVTLLRDSFGAPEVLGKVICMVGYGQLPLRCYHGSPYRHPTHGFAINTGNLID